MYKKIFLSILLVVGIVFSVMLAKNSVGEVFGFYKDGEYTNIYGSGPVSCKNPDECNSLYYPFEPKYCSPDSGTCTGDKDKGVWALKLTCEGKDTECGGNGSIPMVEPPEWSQGTLTLDSGNIKCNQTVQIDVFDKKCDESGTWDMNCKTLGYMSWYSGACPADTPPPAPACNTDCSADPTICQQATDGCTACLDNGSGGKTCQPPAGPACNTDCSADPTICQQATDGCTACVDNSSGGKSCQVPPGTTTTPPPPNPPTEPPQQPTATPVPDFNEAMCQCDSMTVSQILAGQPAIFTATSKVTGSDVTKAEAKQIEFLLTAGNDASSRKVIAGPERVNTTASGSSTEMKYSAQWTTNIPANVEKNVEYVARATIKCSRKTTAQAYPYTAMVLGESSERGGLFSMISNFFKNIFGGDKTDKAPVSTQGQHVASQDDTLVSVADKGNIQIGTFTTGTVTYNKCPEVRFKFK